MSSVAGVLTARLSATDAAANHIVARVQSYPLIFVGALTVAATTLGSRLLGERQQRRFVQLGMALLGWALLLAVLCGVGLLFFVDSVYEWLTSDPATLAALQPTRAVLPFYIGAALINAVAGGLVLAAHEWIWLPIASGLSLGLIYAPAVAWVTHTGRTSIASLLVVNSTFVVLQAIVKLCVVCILVPRKLRLQAVRQVTPTSSTNIYCTSMSSLSLLYTHTTQNMALAAVLRRRRTRMQVWAAIHCSIDRPSRCSRHRSRLLHCSHPSAVAQTRRQLQQVIEASRLRGVRCCSQQLRGQQKRLVVRLLADSSCPC